MILIKEVSLFSITFVFVLKNERTHTNTLEKLTIRKIKKLVITIQKESIEMLVVLS